MADAEEVKELYKKIRDIQSKQLKIQNEFIRTFRQGKNKTTQQQPGTSSSNTTTETLIESKNNALISIREAQSKIDTTSTRLDNAKTLLYEVNEVKKVVDFTVNAINNLEKAQKFAITSKKNALLLVSKSEDAAKFLKGTADATKKTEKKLRSFFIFTKADIPNAKFQAALANSRLTNALQSIKNGGNNNQDEKKEGYNAPQSNIIVPGPSVPQLPLALDIYTQTRRLTDTNRRRSRDTAEVEAPKVDIKTILNNKKNSIEKLCEFATTNASYAISQVKEARVIIMNSNINIKVLKDKTIKTLFSEISETLDFVSETAGYITTEVNNIISYVNNVVSNAIDATNDAFGAAKAATEAIAAEEAVAQAKKKLAEAKAQAKAEAQADAQADLEAKKRYKGTTAVAAKSTGEQAKTSADELLKQINEANKAIKNITKDFTKKSNFPYRQKKGPIESAKNEAQKAQEAAIKTLDAANNTYNAANNTYNAAKEAIKLLSDQNTKIEENKNSPLAIETQISKYNNIDNTVSLALVTYKNKSDNTTLGKFIKDVYAKVVEILKPLKEEINSLITEFQRLKPVLAELKTQIEKIKNTTNVADDNNTNEMIQKDADAANQQTNMLVLLNNLINETSIVSMLSDKRYLYTIQVKNKNKNNTYTNVFKNEEIENIDTKSDDDNDGKPIDAAVITPVSEEINNEGDTTKQFGGENDNNQRLNFKIQIKDINQLEYDNIYIVEYRTDNIEEIDKFFEGFSLNDFSINDLYQYIANFQKYIEKNNEGKNMDFADRTKDRSLLVKRYPIHQYFTTFNKNNGLDYKGVKNAYVNGDKLYIKAIKFYEKRLDAFLQKLENYRSSNNENTGWFNTKGIDLWYTMVNHYGFIIIIIILIILFVLHLSTFTSFINSVYQRKLSLQPSIIDDSMYAGYADIANVYMPALGEMYYERIAMATFLAYFLLFIFVVLINLWYISDALQGRMRVWNFIPLHWIITSTHELYIFDKRANFVMYYGLMILIFIIIVNILYYLIIFNTQSDTFKTRYESNKELQELYENIDKDLLKYLLDNNIEEVDGVKLNTIDLKLAHWMYGGTVQQLETRIGRTNPEAADMENTKKKRFKILLTVVFVKHYVGPKYKKELSNITDIEEDPLPNVFLYSRSQLLDGVLPQRYDKVVFGNTLDIINRPPEDLRNAIAAKKTNKDDENFCKNIGDQFYCGAGNKNNDFSFLDGNTLLLNEYFNKNYQQVYRSIQDARRKIRSQDSAILYRVDVILSFIFMLLIGFCLLQIFLWLFFDNIDVYEIFFIKHKSKLQTIFQIIVVVVILIVIL
jgi:hypothetical protein